MRISIVAASTMFLIFFGGVAAASAADDIDRRQDVQYADHEGTKLLGDFYLPKRATMAPVLVAIHGGGWERRGRKSYQYWGPYLAKHNIAVFEIAYRLAKAGMYPRSVYDVKSAVQFVRANAANYGIDPDRIGLMGDSAGGHLTALVALAGDEFGANASEPNGNVSPKVKVAISFYGIYDMAEQWDHDQTVRPEDQITELYLGSPLFKNRRIYFESSPLSYATTGRTNTRFLIINGTEDDIVNPLQAKIFHTALNQAGIYSRRIVVPGAGHFWASDPFEDDPQATPALVASRILRFLQDSL